MLDVEQLQAVDGVAREDTRDPPVREEGVSSQVEHPLRIAELRLLLRQRVHLAVGVPSVEPIPSLPPARRTCLELPFIPEIWGSDRIGRT